AWCCRPLRTGRREAQRLGDRRRRAGHHDRRRPRRLAGHRRRLAGDRLRRLPRRRPRVPAHRGPPHPAPGDGPDRRVIAVRHTYLLVHGAWHSAAHWNRVAEHLTARGHRVDAIDLPGSGLDARYPHAYLSRNEEALATELSPVSDVNLADYR